MLFTLVYMDIFFVQRLLYNLNNYKIFRVYYKIYLCSLYVMMKYSIHMLHLNSYSKSSNLKD